jgi:outer membrane protein
MNASYRSLAIALSTALCLMMFTACPPALAFDGGGPGTPEADSAPRTSGVSDVVPVGEKLAEFDRDPLRTQPHLAGAGLTLPGDTAAPICAASVTADQPLSLATAIDLALCNSPLIRSAWADIEIQAAGLGEAKGAYLPTLTAGLSRTSDRTVYPGIGSQRSTLVGNGSTAGLTWRLFDFGGRNANLLGADDLLSAAIASHAAAIQKALDTVIGAYFDVQSANATLDAKQAGEVLARDTLEAAHRREARGVGSQTETLQAAVGLAKASLDRSRAHGDVLKGLAQLTYALGLPADSQFTLAADLADDTRNLGPELSRWLTDAESMHPAILAARAQLEAAREKVVATEAEGRPSLDASVNFYRNGRPSQGLPALQTNERVIALTLNVPLFDGFANKYKVRGAQAQAEQKEAELQDVSHQILLDVLKAHADAVAALDNLELSQALLSASQSAMESVQRKFDRGASDILDMLSAQAALADARQQRVRSLAEWRSARLRLMASAGILGHANLH